MRRTRHRRRFHTDRVVAARRARYIREATALRRERIGPLDGISLRYDEWPWKRLTYGRLASTDPWDCGNPRCGCCHWDEPRRAREKREWQRIEAIAW
jgi:hypothetical protein